MGHSPSRSGSTHGVLLLVLLLAWLVPPPVHAERPRDQKVCSHEDGSSFEPAGAGDDPTDRLKNIRLGSVTSLSVGGQLRLRSEAHQNPDLGLAPVPFHDVRLLRGLVHLDLRSRGGFRSFLEVGSAVAAGGEQPERPIDEDLFSVRQAFVDAELVRGHLRLRVGRQELPLGSGRLVALRDGPNVRLSFDGARFTFTHGRGTVDGLGAAGVAVQPGVFDDHSDPGEALWGLYSTTRLRPEGMLSVDAYYLGLRREGAAFGTDVGLERRHSLGTRLFGVRGPYDYNVEVIGQAGTFAGRPIAAWTVASDQGVTARWPGFEPRLGLRANVTSGGVAGSRWVHTFNALYPNLAYFSQLAVLSPANHIDLHPRLTAEVLERLRLEVAGDWFWRTSVRDTIYAPPGLPVGVPSDYAGRFVGQELVVSAELALGGHATLTGYYAQLWAGPVVRSLGGADTRLLGVWLSVLV